MKFPPTYVIAGGAIALALLYMATRGVNQAGRDIGGVAVDLADGVLTGAITEIGEGVNVPETNMTECQKAMAEGRTWDASFACPAADFMRYVWN